MERFNITTSLLESHDQDQDGRRANQDPGPFHLRQAGALQLVQILRELMQILIRKLGEPIVDLLLAEAVGSEDLGHPSVRSDVANEREISVSRGDTLIRGSLRWKGSGE